MLTDKEKTLLKAALVSHVAVLRNQNADSRQLNRCQQLYNKLDRELNPTKKG